MFKTKSSYLKLFLVAISLMASLVFVTSASADSKNLAPLDNSFFNSSASPGLFQFSTLVSDSYTPYMSAYSPDHSKIYVAYRNNTTGELRILRRNEDGSNDTNYVNNGVNDTGLIIANASNKYRNYVDVNNNYYFIQPDDEVDNNNLEVYKYKNDGVLDSGFGVAGKVTVPAITGTRFNNLIVKNTTDYLYIGSAHSDDLLFVLINKTDGALDNSFGVSGIKRITGAGGIPDVNNFDSFSTGNFTMFVTPGGQAYVGIRASTTIDSNTTILFNLTTNGSVNSGFGFFEPHPGYIFIYPPADTNGGVQVMPMNFIDNKLYVTQSRTNLSDNALHSSLTRYYTDGSIDTTFANNGVKTFSNGVDQTLTYPVALNKVDGKYLLFKTVASPFIADASSITGVTYNIETYSSSSLNAPDYTTTFNTPYNSVSNSIKFVYILLPAFASSVGNEIQLNDQGVSGAWSGTALNLKQTFCTTSTTPGTPTTPLVAKDVKGKTKTVKVGKKKKKVSLRIKTSKAYTFDNASSEKVKFILQAKQSKKKGAKKKPVFRSAKATKVTYYWKVPGKKTKYKKTKLPLSLKMMGQPAGDRTLKVKGTYKGKKFNLSIKVKIQNPAGPGTNGTSTDQCV